MQILPAPEINADPENTSMNPVAQQVPGAAVVQEAPVIQEVQIVQELQEVHVIQATTTAIINPTDGQIVPVNIIPPIAEPLPAPTQIEKDDLDILFRQYPMIFKEKFKMIEESLMRANNIDLILTSEPSTKSIYYKVFGQSEDGKQEHVMNVMVKRGDLKCRCKDCCSCKDSCQCKDCCSCKHCSCYCPCACKCCCSCCNRPVKVRCFTGIYLFLETVDGITIGIIKYPVCYNKLSSVFAGDTYVSRVAYGKNGGCCSSSEDHIYDKNEKKVFIMPPNGCCSSKGIGSNSILLTNVYDADKKSMAYRVTIETRCCDCCDDDIYIKVIKSSNQHPIGMLPLVQAAVFYTLPKLKLETFSDIYHNELRRILGKKEHRPWVWSRIYLESITTGDKSNIDYVDL